MTPGPVMGFDSGVGRDYGTAVMYEGGKIAFIGGGDPPTASVERIDLASATPVWTFAASLAAPRRMHNATILADGKVLVTGGTSSPGFNDATEARRDPELWDPATNTWTTMATMSRVRLYHSEALLLPDGRLLASGGGHPSPDNPPIEGGDNFDGELFSPPYLFKGTRPVISSAPSRSQWGKTIFVGTSSASQITRVNLIRHSSVTHSDRRAGPLMRPARQLGQRRQRATWR